MLRDTSCFQETVVNAMFKKEKKKKKKRGKKKRD